jgi:hypothetical protein
MMTGPAYVGSAEWRILPRRNEPTSGPEIGIGGASRPSHTTVRLYTARFYARRQKLPRRAAAQPRGPVRSSRQSQLIIEKSKELLGRIERTIGIARAKVKIGLKNLVYNIPIL